MIFDVLKASSNHVKVQGWEWADMFVVCICVLQWLHIGEVIVCVCALQWFRMSFDHWVSAVCLCGPLPIGVNFSYLKWRQCGEEKRCYGVLKQEVWSGETLCERCRLKHFWHPPHWSTVTVLLWLGCQKWRTHFFFWVLRSAHVEKKRFFKMGIVETCHTHKFYRHLFFWIIYFFPFETSATASCGYTGINLLEDRPCLVSLFSFGSPVSCEGLCPWSSHLHVLRFRAAGIRHSGRSFLWNCKTVRLVPTRRCFSLNVW